MENTATSSGSVLSRDHILKYIKSGEIKFTPQVEDSAINCASVDLKLSNEFRYLDMTEKLTVDPKVGFTLEPGQCCLGMTVESLQLPDFLCGLLEGRSRFARLGFMNPGIDNRQVLEIYNASPRPMLLMPGTKVCQFIFLKMEGKAKYAGKFSKQEKL